MGRFPQDLFCDQLSLPLEHEQRNQAVLTHSSTGAEFLSLPTEVRIKVYQELFRGQTLEIMNWIPPAARRRWDYLGIVAITVACKLCRAEALPIFRQLCTVRIDDAMRLLTRLRTKSGLFDPVSLRQVHCDFVTSSTAVRFVEFARTFPNLRLLTVKCFVIDKFGWWSRGFSPVALKRSAALRRKKLGGIINGETCIAAGVRWVERAWETDAAEMDAWPARVVVRMRLCAVLAGQRHDWDNIGHIAVDIRKKELYYEADGNAYAIEPTAWTTGCSD